MSLFHHDDEKKPMTKVATAVGTSKLKHKLDLKTEKDVENVSGPAYEISLKIPDYEFIFRIRTK